MEASYTYRLRLTTETELWSGLQPVDLGLMSVGRSHHSRRLHIYITSISILNFLVHTGYTRHGISFAILYIPVVIYGFSTQHIYDEDLQTLIIYD